MVWKEWKHLDEQCSGNNTLMSLCCLIPWMHSLWFICIFISLIIMLHLIRYWSFYKELLGMVKLLGLNNNISSACSLCSTVLLISHQLINLSLLDFPSLSLTLMSCCWHTNPFMPLHPFYFRAPPPPPLSLASLSPKHPASGMHYPYSSALPTLLILLKLCYKTTNCQTLKLIQ